MYDDEEAMRETVAAGGHRTIVGGLWDELGNLQLEFLVSQGLRPWHRLLDVGCGPLRAGVKIVPYLDPGNYFGIDISRPLLEAGYDQEIVAAGLDARLPRSNLIVTGTFDVSELGTAFEYALAQSVFTHVPRAELGRCLDALHPFLIPSGVFFSTWFLCPYPSSAHPTYEQPAGFTTSCDGDLYHSSREEIMKAAAKPGWRPIWIGPWEHPRGQQMLASVRL